MKDEKKLDSFMASTKQKKIAERYADKQDISKSAYYRKAIEQYNKRNKRNYG